MANQQKTTIQAWVDATTCHGVADLFNSKCITGKVFWFLLLMACLGLALWQIGELAVQFGSEPHYTTHTYQDETEFAEFPNVTVCNFNRAHRQRAIDAGMVDESGAFDPDLLNYLYLSFPGEYDMALYGHEFFKNRTAGYAMLNRMREKYRSWQKKTNMTDLGPVEVIKLLGYTCREMINECRWKTMLFDCCSHAHRVINLYGLCYSVTPPIADGDTVAKQTIPGYKQGLSLSLDVMLDTYVMEVVQYNYLEAGMIVNINYNPYEMDITNPIGLRAKSKVWVSLKGRKRYAKHPQVRVFPRDCYQNLKLDILKGEYTRSTCIFDCLQKTSLEMCGCVAVAEIKVTGIKFCDGFEYLDCFMRGMFWNINFGMAEKFQKCIKLCGRLSCQERLEVDTSVSTTAKFPDDRAKYIVERAQKVFNLPAGYTNEDKLMGTISLHIFFSEIAQLVMEKNEKIPVFQLISYVDGQLGLWLGISILTIIQAFYHLVTGMFSGHRIPDDHSSSAAERAGKNQPFHGDLKIIPLKQIYHDNGIWN